MSKEGKTVALSRVVMTEVVLPQFTNSIGTVFGGQVMSWIDICAAVSAQRHARSSVVTASIDSVHFIAPIKKGHVVVLESQVNAAFGSSMEVGVRVFAEDPISGEKHHAVRAYCTFVSLDDKGKPQKVPPLVLENAADKSRNDAAKRRREDRLKSRKVEEAH